jgi:mannosyltransferase OCH1-like enzyme
MLLADYRYADALKVLKQSFDTARNLAQAIQVVDALYGLNHLKLAMRYLKFCLRKWPEKMAIVTQIAKVFAKACRAAEAIALLQNGASKVLHANGLFHHHMSILHCQIDQSVEALEYFRRAQSMGNTNLNGFGLVVRSLAYCGEYDLLSELIAERQSKSLPHPDRYYSTLSGQLVTEIKLEMDGPNYEKMRATPEEDLSGLADLMRAAPRSNFAAMRLLHGWRLHGQRKASQEGAECVDGIPANIYQYWNDSEPPEMIAEMIETWQCTPGYMHRLYNKATALAELRTSFGPDYARAFLMARNPAEESDFLRLCLLALHGGVYADADDIRTGPLTSLAGLSTGLAVYAEREGGTLGNNFMAARAQHPVIVFAARSARLTLLARDNESTWSKTGPGLLTRAVAAYIASCIGKGTAPDLTIFSMGELLDQIAMHNPARHKNTSGYWNATSTQTSNDLLVQLLEKQIRLKAGQSDGAVG